MSSNNGSLIKPTLVDAHQVAGTVNECKGRLMLAAFDGIKPDDVSEIVQGLVQRAKAGDNGAVKIVLGMLATPPAPPKKKKRARDSVPGVPAPSRRVAADEDDDPGPNNLCSEEHLQPADAGDPLACRHCGKTGRKLRPRGLCYKCSYDPAIRDQYPSTSKFASNQAKGLSEHVPTDEELDEAADKLRTTVQPVAARIEAIIGGHFGAATTYQQVLNHLREDGLTCSPEEFAAVKDRLHPPPEDWKRPMPRRGQAG